MRKQILVIDDDSLILFIHRSMIKDAGIVVPVEYFVDAASALKHMDAQTDTNISYLLLLDINMPEMDGWQMMEVLKNRQYYNQTFVFMITSSINKEDEIRARGYERVFGYQSKPLKMKHIKQMKEEDSIAMFFK